MMEAQKKYDLWQSSVNSNMYPVPAIIEKEKLVRMKKQEQRNANFGIDNKVKGKLFPKKTTALEDAEPMEIDLDKSMEQQKARAAEKAERDKKSRLFLAKEIKKNASTFMIDLKQNKELSGESKKQNEDLLKRHINEFLKIESGANIERLSTALFKSEEKIEDLNVGQKDSKKMKTINAIHTHISAVIKKIKEEERESRTRRRRRRRRRRWIKTPTTMDPKNNQQSKSYANSFQTGAKTAA